MSDPLMHLADVSVRTGISENTLRYWRKRGEGPPAGKLGKRVVYRQSELEAWIDAHFDAADAS